MAEKVKKALKKTNTLDKYVIFCLVFLVLYTISHTVIFLLTGKEAKVLDALVFGTFGGEILQCFFIKKGKLHEEAKIVLGKKKKDEDTFNDVDDFSDEIGGEIDDTI